MREIKFRAWDKENEAMVYPKGILFDGRIVNFSCGMLESYDGYELMQYTGLKDKNFKEIYEGDIIECLHEGNGFVTKRYGSYGIETRFGFYPFVDLYGEVEVIGNIYENSELLKS